MVKGSPLATGQPLPLETFRNLTRSQTMDMNAAQTAMRRAAKRFAHASKALANAESEKARKRHARRAVNASRGMAEARRNFEDIASYAMD
jgi:hypothetical protein